MCRTVVRYLSQSSRNAAVPTEMTTDSYPDLSHTFRGREWMARLISGAIADHPRVPPAEMTAIREALGSRFDQFVGFHQAVHETAVELVGAAERRAMGGVLELYRRLQTGCLSCHIAFRDEVRAGLYGQPPSIPNDTSN